MLAGYHSFPLEANLKYANVCNFTKGKNSTLNFMIINQ